MTSSNGNNGLAAIPSGIDRRRFLGVVGAGAVGVAAGATGVLPGFSAEALASQINVTGGVEGNADHLAFK